MGLLSRERVCVYVCVRVCVCALQFLWQWLNGISASINMFIHPKLHTFMFIVTHLYSNLVTLATRFCGNPWRRMQTVDGHIVTVDTFLIFTKSNASQFSKLIHIVLTTHMLTKPGTWLKSPVA